MKIVDLKCAHRMVFRPGEVVLIRSNHSLAKEPLRLRVEKVVRDVVNDYIVATLLHRETGDDGPKVIVKRMITGIMRGGEPDPMIPHLLPHITIAVEETRGRIAGNNVVQLYVPGKPDPKTLARDLAYLFARSIHYYGFQHLHDVRPENIGNRPFDIGITDPELTKYHEKRFGSYPAWFLKEWVAKTVQELYDKKSRRLFWQAFKEQVERFLSSPEEVNRYEMEERKKLVEILKKLGYSPRKTMRLG